MILASIALFAVLFSTLGLIAACVGAVVVAGAATAPVRWLQLVLFGAGDGSVLGAAVRQGSRPALPAWPQFWPW